MACIAFVVAFLGPRRDPSTVSSGGRGGGLDLPAIVSRPMALTFASLLALGLLLLLVSLFEPEATLPLGGRCCTPYYPISWPVHELTWLLIMACAVFMGLAFTSIVSRKTIAVGALAIAAPIFLIGGALLASTVAAKNPFRLDPPLTPAIGMGTLLILGAGVACAIVGVAALLSGDRRDALSNISRA